jgi:hypothetical protein
VDIGDLATWVGSSLAAVAAGATLWTLKSQRDQIREQRAFIGEQSATMALEREALRATAEDRKWSQARQIRMHHHKGGSTTDGEGNTVGPTHWIVTVLNTSDAPVHGVEVRFGTAYMAAEVYELAPSATNNLGAQLGDRLVAPVHLFGPGRAIRFLSQRWSAATVHNNRPGVTFKDDSGVAWSLDSYGKLEEVLPGPAA